MSASLSPTEATGGVASIAAVVSTISENETCDQWAAVAAREEGVPVPLMRAIAFVESGRRDIHSPQRSKPAWPWTVGTGDGGRWFENQSEALSFARRSITSNRQPVDIGCFQLNHRWHGRAFDTLDQMFDPAMNSRYAALFLASLHDESGDWTRAVAAYHSRTPQHGRAYVARVADALTAFSRIPRSEVDFAPMAQNAPDDPAWDVRSTAHGGRTAEPLAPLRRMGPTDTPKLSAGSVLTLGNGASPLIDLRGAKRP